MMPDSVPAPVTDDELRARLRAKDRINDWRILYWYETETITRALACRLLTLSPDDLQRFRVLAVAIGRELVTNHKPVEAPAG